MRIAIVIDCYYDKGNGTSVSARNCVRELIKRGVEVTVLCAKGESVDKVSTEDIVEFDVLKVPFYQRIIEAQHAQLAMPNVGKICKAFKGVDAVHIYMPFFLGTSCMKIARSMSIPVLGCYHLSAENITYNAHMKYLPGATALTYRALKAIHYRYDAMRDIFCPSARIAQVLLSHGYKQNLHIISNGYDPIFQKRTELYDNSDGRYIIACVGRLTKEKRQDVIIRAIARSKFRDQIDLYLAGAGAQKTHYQKLAKRLKVNLKVVYYNKPQLCELFNRCYLYVQASDVETEGIACLEAIACGVVPIISNAKMCASQQYALNYCSLFKHGSPDSLAEKIDFWIDRRKLRDKTSLTYAEFAKRFSLENHVTSLIGIYENMISKADNFYCVRDYNGKLNVEISGLKNKITPTKRLTKSLANVMKRDIY